MSRERPLVRSYQFLVLNPPALVINFMSCYQTGNIRNNRPYHKENTIFINLFHVSLFFVLRQLFNFRMGLQMTFCRYSCVSVTSAWYIEFSAHDTGRMIIDNCPFAVYCFAVIRNRDGSRI